MTSKNQHQADLLPWAFHPHFHCYKTITNVLRNVHACTLVARAYLEEKGNGCQHTLNGLSSIFR